MADTVYNQGKKGFMDGSVDWDTHIFRVMLVTSVYVVNPDHLFVNNGSGTARPDANELSGGSYVRKTLTTTAPTQNDTNDRAEADATDVTWDPINAGTAAAAIIYKQVGGDDTTPGDDILICYIDSGGFPKVTNGGALTISWNAAGILNAT